VEYLNSDNESEESEGSPPDIDKDLMGYVNSFACDDYVHVGQLATKMSFTAASNEIKRDGGTIVEIISIDGEWKVRIDGSLSIAFTQYLDAARAFIDAYAKHKG